MVPCMKLATSHREREVVEVLLDLAVHEHKVGWVVDLDTFLRAHPDVQAVRAQSRITG